MLALYGQWERYLGVRAMKAMVGFAVYSSNADFQ
jgi:hypothetical protein